ncbi:MAG: c-type cytochrome [Rhizobiales bacterium]|nr:c-type cytochrome [Hyphomicrobiales bacterium]
MLRTRSNKHPSRRFVFANWRVGAIWLAIFFSVLAIGAFLFAWSGLYSVAASRGHWPGFNLVLEFGMRSSVRTHALGIEIPNLEDQALIERGAGHFQGGCAPCHGAPGKAPSPIVRAMLPVPPDLGASVHTWKANELFWIVKHGLKYTGMPAWAAQERDDEVWAVVAFLQRLRQTSPAEYQALANLEPRQQDVPIRALAQGGPVGTGLAACSRCHGLDGAGRESGAFPRLDIQTADYLFTQLETYVVGTRHSGIMQPVAAELEAAEMRRLAEYYSAQRSPQKQTSPAGDEPLRAMGQMLATAGLPDEGIPPCMSCHAEDPASRDPLYPAIAGQYANYTSQQLELFKSGKRRATPAGEIMTVLAQRLTSEQIKALSLYLAELPPPQADR